MESLKIRFADNGGENTSFLAKLLRQRGAEEVDVRALGENAETGTCGAAGYALCDVVLDCGGLDYEELKKQRPDIILVSITGFGLTGPRKDWAADPFIAAAAGGSMNMCGREDMAPLAPAGAQAEKIAGLFALNGIILALLERRHTGEGKHLDISMQEAVAAALDLVLVRSYYYGEDPHRTGSLAWGKQTFIVPARNGHIMVHIKPYEWQTLVDWMDGDGMAADLTGPGWQDRAYREANMEHVMDVVSAWSRGYDKEELFETAQLMRMAWAIVKQEEDL